MLCSQKKESIVENMGCGSNRDLGEMKKNL